MTIVTMSEGSNALFFTLLENFSSFPKNNSKTIIDICNHNLTRYIHQSDQIYLQVHTCNEYE